MDENAYHPMTANEAGAQAKISAADLFASSHDCVHPYNKTFTDDHTGDICCMACDEVLVGSMPDTPSKPCTEGGEHCFCIGSAIQAIVPYHRDVVCCWCGKGAREPYKKQRIPGHGPYRKELVRE